MSQAKKLEKEYERGIAEGTEGANTLWHAALENTKYVGPKTQQRILTTLKEIVRGYVEAGKGGSA